NRVALPSGFLSCTDHDTSLNARKAERKRFGRWELKRLAQLPPTLDPSSHSVAGALIPNRAISLGSNENQTHAERCDSQIVDPSKRNRVNWQLILGSMDWWTTLRDHAFLTYAEKYGCNCLKTRGCR